jgi:hypothetical protein
MNWTVIGIWIGALLTLCIYSFLYKDNPFYKFAEHVYVGISAGYLLAQDFWIQLRPNLFLPLWNDYAQGQVHFGFIPAHWYLFIPGILGLLVFTIFIPKVSWMFRYTLAFTVGVFSGLAITAELSSRVLPQIESTIQPLLAFPAGHFSTWGTFCNLVLVAGVLSTLVYFFFSKEHKGFIGAGAKLGIWYLMVAFGAAFGYTVMARISLLIGRMQFLLGDWLHLMR